MAVNRKMRWMGTLGALAVAVGLVTTAYAAPAPDSSPGTAIAIMQASAALQSNDCAAAKAPLNLLWNDPYLDTSDPDLAARFRASLIACVAQSDGIKAAISLSGDNIKRPTATVAAFDMHVFLLLMDQQLPAAARALDDTLARFPSTAGELSDMSVMGVVAQIMDSDKPQFQVLMNHMEDVKWQVHNPSMRPLIGILRIQALRAALGADDAAHAAQYRTDIATDSLIYAFTQGDGELSDPAVAPMDVRPVLTGEINNVQAFVVNSPTQLGVLSYLMMLERANSQDSQALTQLNGILALVDQYGIQNFQDLDSYPDLLANRVSLLADLGRRGEADQAYAEATTRLTPLGAIGLNLTYMNYLTDRGDETAALALESKFTGVALQDGQAAQLIAIKACAYAYQGNEPAYAQMMTALGGLPTLRIKPALCAGDMDGAAADLIAAIQDPAARWDTITYMQNTLPAIAYGERDKAQVARALALKARPDVVAAAQAAKINIRTWPLRY